MTNMNRELYDALHSAQGVSEQQAQAAAESIAGYSAGFASFTKDIDARFTSFTKDIDARFAIVGGRLEGIEKRLDRCAARLDNLDVRLTRVERDLFLLKWMLGAVLLGVFSPIVKAWVM